MAFSFCLFNYTQNKEKDTGPNTELAQWALRVMEAVPAHPALNAGAGGQIRPWW